MTDLTLAVPRDARVIANVLVPDGGYLQFRSVLEDANGARRFHWLVVLEPQDLRRRGAPGLTAQNNCVAEVHVDHLFWHYTEGGCRCKNNKN